jgi:hypothetical protein
MQTVRDRTREIGSLWADLRDTPIRDYPAAIFSRRAMNAADVQAHWDEVRFLEEETVIRRVRGLAVTRRDQILVGEYLALYVDGDEDDQEDAMRFLREFYYNRSLHI